MGARAHPPGSPQRRGGHVDIRIQLAAIFAALSLVGSTTAIAAPQHEHHARVAQHRHFKHHKECHTRPCAHRADILWAKHREALRLRREAREARERPPVSGLEACIISHESGGDPTIRDKTGKFSGIGQWEQSRWESDGGLRYARTPTEASYTQQEKVLRGEGEAGMIDQQGQYDGCA